MLKAIFVYRGKVNSMLKHYVLFNIVGSKAKQGLGRNRLEKYFFNLFFSFVESLHYNCITSNVEAMKVSNIIKICFSY